MIGYDAARWALRRKAGPLPPLEEKGFQTWLAADERREGELLQADVILAFADRAQSVLPTPSTRQVLSRRKVFVGGTAALAASAAGLSLLPASHALRTDVGQIQRTQLADTSTVTLNTQSGVDVLFEKHQRLLTLKRGEAWFQVAHDRSRPFIVSAAYARIKAVGTAFSVRRLATGVDVLVTQGRVEIWRADQPLQRIAVTQGRRAFVPDDGVAIVPVREDAGIDRALAWRSGHLALSGESLDYAISEMNRYNPMQLRVDDPGLGRQPVIGYFDVNDPMQFARLIAGLKDARVEAQPGMIRIIPNSS